MKDTLNFNELARDARRALDEERECLTEMARKVESYGQLLDAAKELAAENEELKDQLQEMTTKLNEMGKLVAGVAKKSSEDDVIKFIRVFVNRSKQKTIKKRTLIKEMVLEFTYANGIVLPDDLMAAIYALDDEQPEAKVVNVAGNYNDIHNNGTVNNKS